jgi:hypothetical protein
MWWMKMTNKINSRKVGFGTFATYTVLFLLLMGVNGMLNFVAADFDWSIVSTSTYWLKTLAGVGSGLGAFAIFSFLSRDIKVAKDADYNKDLDILNKTIDESVGPDFPDFTAEETRNMKKEAWRNKIELKIANWNKHITSRMLRWIQLIKKDKLPRKTIFNFIVIARAHRKLNKLNKLYERRTPAWIEENIDYVKVVHSTITPSEIINGEKGSQSRKIIDNNAIAHILRDRSFMIILTTAIQAFYHALVISKATDLTALALTLIVQFITIFMNVAFGLNYGKTLFRRLDKNNLLTRKNYIMKYLSKGKK